MCGNAPPGFFICIRFTFYRYMKEYWKPKIRTAVFLKYNGKCAYCGKNVSDCLTIDHIIPLKRKNPNYNRRFLYGIENMNPCCPSCNSSKGTMTIEEWRNDINKKYVKLLESESSFNLLVRLGIIAKPKRWIFFFEKFNLKHHA